MSTLKVTTPSMDSTNRRVAANRLTVSPSASRWLSEGTPGSRPAPGCGSGDPSVGTPSCPADRSTSAPSSGPQGPKQRPNERYSESESEQLRRLVAYLLLPECSSRRIPHHLICRTCSESVHGSPGRPQNPARFPHLCPPLPSPPWRFWREHSGPVLPDACTGN